SLKSDASQSNQDAFLRTTSLFRLEAFMDSTLVRGNLPPVRWSAVAAGVAFSLAIHVALGLFGAALGFAAQGNDSRALGLFAGVLALMTAFTAAFLGAVLAARLAAHTGAGAAELHALLVWCVAVVAGVLFLSGPLSGSALG